jgi:N-acetylmuramoyl-L-alanine amidase
MTLICIDPGHGGDHPGACYFGHEEKTATLAIAKLLRPKLEDAGFSVIMTRKSDADVSLKRRCEISNDARAAAFVSIHLNACKSPGVRGAETWKWYQTRPFSQTLADAVQAGMIAATDAKDRGVKTNKAYYVLHHTVASALVVECGFMSNEKECKKLFTPSYQEQIAEGICEGIKKAFANP